MFSKKIHEAVGTSATLGFFIAFPGAIILMISGSNIDNLPTFSFGYLNIIIVLLVSSTSVFTANLGAKVLIHDDLLATGGTAFAAAQLVNQTGAQTVAFAFLVNLTFLEADKRLKDISETIISIVNY